MLGDETPGTSHWCLETEHPLRPLDVRSFRMSLKLQLHQRCWKLKRAVAFVEEKYSLLARSQGQYATTCSVMNRTFRRLQSSLIRV